MLLIDGFDGRFGKDDEVFWEDGLRWTRSNPLMSGQPGPRGIFLSTAKQLKIATRRTGSSQVRLSQKTRRSDIATTRNIYRKRVGIVK